MQTRIPVLPFIPLVSLILLAASDAAGQTPNNPSQNPSPMVESTREHLRIPNTPVPGERRTFEGPGGKPVQVFLPAGLKRNQDVRLLIHFHGAAYVPEYAAVKAGKNHIVATVQLGAGSGTYDRGFTEPAVFDTLLAQIRQTAGVTQPLRSITLSGFSAGHGAIRAILRDSAHYDMIDAVLLLDGMHTSYVPDRTPIAEGGKIDPTNLQEFIRFGRDAMAGRKRFRVTHSEIFPGTFSSTTETANYLLDALGLKRKHVLKWGPLGMQQTSEARKGRFVLQSFAGNSAPDHIDHYHGMYWFLKELVK